MFTPTLRTIAYPYILSTTPTPTPMTYEGEGQSIVNSQERFPTPYFLLPLHSIPTTSTIYEGEGQSIVNSQERFPTEDEKTKVIGNYLAELYRRQLQVPSLLFPPLLLKYSTKRGHF